MSAQRNTRTSRVRLGPYVLLGAPLDQVLLDAPLDQAPLEQEDAQRRQTTPTFAPLALKHYRAARLRPFAAGPFSIFVAPSAQDSTAWRVALRDALRAPMSTCAATIIETSVDDPRLPLYFVTPMVFGIPLLAVVVALERSHAVAPDSIARALAHELTSQLEHAHNVIEVGGRARPARADALVVTWTGKIVDARFAPSALARGMAAGVVDLDRVARSYGALLARVRSDIAEVTALQLLQSSTLVANDVATARPSDGAQLAAFLAAQFPSANAAQKSVQEEHALLDDSALALLTTTRS